MQCNQPYYGNSFTNGPFGSPFNTPLQSSQGMYPEIVGEGHVTSLTLPDGSVQFFFMPTIKWWSPNASQCHPFQTIPNPMFANTNYSIPPPCNNNIGTWFIRSVSNPFPQNAFSPPNQRNELPRLAIDADYNRNFNNHDTGYQVKFHNDDGTSTTDLVYFYPGLRKRDFVFMPPCKDKTVQIDTAPVTNNTVCHYQVVCSKPCNCLLGARPMSLETLVIPNLTPQSNQSSNYSTGAKPIRESPPDPNLSPKKTCDCSICAKAVNLESPADPSPKRLKTCNCVCSKSLSFESAVEPNLSSKNIKICDCSVCVKPVSLVPPVEPNLTSKSIKTCDCSVSAKPMSLKSTVKLNLTNKSVKPSVEPPADPNLNLKSKTDTKPMSVECQADENFTSKTEKPCNCSVDSVKPMSLESLADPNSTANSTNTSTDDSTYKKKQNKRSKNTKKSKVICCCYPEEKKKKRSKSKNIISNCEPTVNIVSVDKSITTYTDESVGQNPVDGRETQTSRKEDITAQCDVDTKPVQNKAPQKTKWIDKDCCSDCCSSCDERSGDNTKNKKYTQRSRGGKYKRSKSNKCECGCCTCESSMDCCSEVETVISKDNGCETPCTCCTTSNTTYVLENARDSPIKIGQRASIGKENSSLQWLKPDNLSQKCELCDTEMSEPPVSPALNKSVSSATNPPVSPAINPSVSPATNPSVSPATNPPVSPATNPSVSPATNPSASPATNPSVSPATVMDGESPEKLLNPTCSKCDAAPSTCGDECMKQ
ncbi:hypothetical protein PYW08_002684 [Mythimna loreyi]|uniref:Uncharacterized protein n=1 Tax=Mythimna loreyi TaxID=667449 RepID=A0ACC2QJT2_9NEOP|nr:hypothetical protein PYW08_002684 [Mythimna loreyi]